VLLFFGYHFRGLLDFSGRESRKPFWLWVAFCLSIHMFVLMACMIPIMLKTFMQIERFAAQHPDQVTRTYGPGSYSVQVHGYHPELFPDMFGFMLANSIGASLAVILLAASVCRRLHDSNRTGAWGLLPLPFLMTALLLFPSLMPGASRGFAPDMGLFLALVANNFVYLAAIGVLVFKLVLPGTRGENRFGLAPLM
jgi:uncharacterized membrane protein YhaH (DUF805 family)